MSKMFCLTRVLLKTSLGSINQAMATNKKKRKVGIGNKLLYLVLLICLIPTFIMLGVAGYEGYGMLSGIGQEGLIVGFICIMGSMATFVFAISIVLSIFYMSRDVEMLLPLPFRPWEIVGAKFTVTWLYEAATTALLLLPPFIGFGIAAKGDVLYWIFAVLGTALLPLAPLVYVGIILMVIMRVFKGIKNKDFLNMAAMVIVLVAVMALSFSMQSMEEMSQAELVAMLSAGENSMLGIVKSLFPHLIFLEKALLNGDVVSMLIFVAASAGFVLVFLAAANFLYFGGVAGMNETATKRRKISEEESTKINRQAGVVASYARKERRILFRTPIYFLNCAMLSFLWPVVLILPIVMEFVSKGSMDIGTMILAVKTELVAMSGQEKMLLTAVVLFAVYCLCCLSLSMTVASGTAMSREGAGFTYMKYIPLSYRDQLKGKLLCGLEICSVGTIGYTMILVLLGVIFLGVPVLALPLALVLSLLLNVLFNCLQMMVDLWKPKLFWETETQAVKQNMNVMIEMFGMMGIAVLFGFIFWKLFGGMTKAGLSAWLPILLCLGIVAIAAFFAYRAVLRIGERMLDNLE